MKSLYELAREAGVSTRYVGNQILIPGTDALSFVDALATAGALILGIEGFDFEDSALCPDRGLIADFSGVTDPGESASEARQFFREVERPDAFFEFFIADENPEL